MNGHSSRTHSRTRSPGDPANLKRVATSSSWFTKRSEAAANVPQSVTASFTLPPSIDAHPLQSRLAYESDVVDSIA